MKTTALKEKKPTRELPLTQVIRTQARLASADFDLSAFLNLVVQQMQKLTPATGVVVELVEKDEMVYRAATGTVAAYIGLRLKIIGSISGLCVKTRKILHSPDTEKDKRVNVEACRKVKARSLVVAPLFYEGKAVGVLKILSKNSDAFDAIDVQILQIMAGFIGSGLAHQLYYDANRRLLNERTEALKELKKAQKKLQHLAQHDYLTDLPNRSLFKDRLAGAIAKVKRTKKYVALMFLDIDHFKTINDTLGHGIGDELLKAFSSRLKQCIRTYDTIARLGGDEFVVLIEEINNKDEAVSIAKKIIHVMEEKFKLGDDLVAITTSIGISFYTDDLTATEFIAEADDALYAAKTSGRNTYKIFNKKKK